MREDEFVNSLAEALKRIEDLRQSHRPGAYPHLGHPISDRSFPPGTTYQTPEGLRAEDEDTRAALDVQGGIYPIRESVFRASYTSAEMDEEMEGFDAERDDRYEVLRRAADRLQDAIAVRAAVGNDALFGWKARMDAEDALLCALQDTRTALDGRERPHRHIEETK